MTNFIHLPCRDDDGNVHVVVEAPRGSLVKLAYDAQLGVFAFKRALPLGVSYPYDWGFVPSTCAADGDPLDAMVMSECASWPGTLTPSRLLGIVRLTQRTEAKERISNDRVILVPVGDERYGDVSDLPARVCEELEKFFVTVSEMTHKAVKIEGWEGPKKAARAIDEAVRAYTRGRAPA